MAYKPFDLTGKVALVTGGNGGIGFGMVEAMAQAGADIVIWGSNAGKNADAAEKLKATGVRVLTQVVNVADEEAVRAGMVEAVAHTGSVITSAGIVLAAVFAALGVLPLVTLGQLGLIVGVGVIVDTLVVRTVIVPAIFTLVGDRIWWPGKPKAAQEELAHERGEHPAVAA